MTNPISRNVTRALAVFHVPGAAVAVVKDDALVFAAGFGTKDLGGSGLGHNPEELFAVGYSACYLGAMRFAAQSEKLGSVPENATVNAHVGMGPRSDGGFGLKVRLVVTMPGVDRALAEKIAERGHHICPYSNATKGNIEVTTEIA